MKRGNKLDLFVSLTRQRSIQILIGVGFLYIIMVALEVPFVFDSRFGAVNRGDLNDDVPYSRPFALGSEEELEERDAPVRPVKDALRRESKPERRITEYKSVSGLRFDGGSVVNISGMDGFLGIQKSAKEAFEVGKKIWEEMESGEEILLPPFQIVCRSAKRSTLK